ncbi:MAG: flagellar basal body L-ring protein FlgH [Hydrogenobaculum sp.]
MKFKKFVYLAFSIITLDIFLNSCASTPHHLKYLPYSAPSQNPHYISKGSLYVPDSPMANLYSDQRAFAVGDLVHILVSESVNAVESISNQTQRSSTFNNAISSFFGLPSSTLRNLGVGASSNTQQKAQGTESQSGVFTTTITAYVKRVYPNGNLLIEGHKIIYLNNVERVITLRGIVRPQDIDSTDTVPSQDIANLEILYQGHGYLVNGSQPGWLARFLAKILPF